MIKQNTNQIYIVWEKQLRIRKNKQLKFELTESMWRFKQLIGLIENKMLNMKKYIINRLEWEGTET